MKNLFKRTLSDADRAGLAGSFVRLSRGYVHYELIGPDDGNVLVLVPGLSVPFSTWERNAQPLAEAGYRVLRYEHYGRGFSDRPSGGYDLDFFVEQLVELLCAIGLERPLQDIPDSLAPSFSSIRSLSGRSRDGPRGFYPRLWWAISPWRSEAQGF